VRHPGSTGRDFATAGGGRLETGLAALGTLRWVVVDLTLPLDEVRRRLDLSPLSAVALGRALVGAVLLRRIALKVPARLILTIDGDGSLGRIVAEASTGGTVRGTIGNPQAETPSDGSMALAPWIGRGWLNVIRERDGESYSSKVELVSGEIGEDLAHYLEQSEQIRSAVLVGVLLQPSGVAAAGGLIVEALPGTPELVVEQLEDNLRSLAGVSATLAAGGAAALKAGALADFDLEPLEDLPLAYECSCSRDSLRDRLRTLAPADLADLLGEGSTCEAECAFCGERYQYSAEELLPSPA
jgi:molecular chaperone Hsp33